LIRCGLLIIDFVDALRSPESTDQSTIENHQSPITNESTINNHSFNKGMAAPHHVRAG
jgi:hypothetical protein